MKLKPELSHKTVAANIASMQNWMKKENVDGFYISSTDPYLNEYVPMQNCHRYYLTGFAGSMAELYVPQTGRVKLYVDGRYHEQADLEVDHDIVEVMKVEVRGLEMSLLKDIELLRPATLGFEADRTSLGLAKKFEKLTRVKAYNNQELTKVVTFGGLPNLKEVTLLKGKYEGRPVKEKLANVIEHKKQAYFVTATDSLAWITNCRGYHLPNLSSFLGRALVVHNKVIVFVDQGVPVEKDAIEHSELDFRFVNYQGLLTELHLLQNEYQLNEVFYDPSMINAADFNLIESIFKDALKVKAQGLINYQSIKDELELGIIRESFNLADTAIYNTIMWTKKMVADGKKVSERDLYNQTSVEYKKMGAIDQSFGTIAGVGPNGSIIHYGDPKEDVFITNKDMCLLDSGGYFAGGFATDTTRTFFAGSGSDANPEYKRMYTLVLKGTLNVMYAVFPVGTRGGYLDALARRALFQTGLNYNHGTGHGIGIHVHEAGAGLSQATQYEMRPGQVVSIEPGLYVPGVAGVRIENIAIVQNHPEFKGYLSFENLVFVGFDPDLIDHSLLNEEEKAWLTHYQSECQKRGRGF